MSFSKIIVFIYLSVFTYKLNAQTSYLEWVNTAGSNSGDSGYAITSDASGNTYITGVFKNVVDFDPSTGVSNLTSNGGWDVFIQKLDPSGNLLWAKSFGGSAFDYGLSINVDYLGNIYTTGRYSGTVDFDPGMGVSNYTANGTADIFVQKLDPSGNLIWVKTFGGTSADIAYSIKTDASGNVFIAGLFQDIVDFDPGVSVFNLSSNGSYDIFIQKLDANGNFLWANSFGGTSDDFAHSIDIDAFDNVYITGQFTGTVDFDPGVSVFNLNSVGGSDIFIQKLDTNGDLVWANSFGGTSGDFGASLSVDPSGNVYTTGYFINSVDFDPSATNFYLSSNGGRDIFVLKLDSSGSFVWANGIGSTIDDDGYAINTDANGNAYVTGRFSNSVDFDPGSSSLILNSTGNDDVFIQKLDPLGSLVWAKSFGGTDDDFGYAITVDPFENVFTTGGFQDNVDFDPNNGTQNHSSLGNDDIFVQKLSQCLPTNLTPNQQSLPDLTGCIINAPSTPTASDGCGHTIVGVSNITFPLTNQNITNITWTYSDTFGNTVTQNQNIVWNPINVNVFNVGISITASNAAATYQWLDCDNNFSEIFGENNQTFTPSFNGNYAVELTENGCIDTSICVSIQNLGLTNYNPTKCKIYPNPASDQITVKLIDKRCSSITILDSKGSKVYETDECKDEYNITLNDLRKGIYFLLITSNEGVSRHKFTKN